MQRGGGGCIGCACTGTTLSVLIQAIAGVQGCRARCGTCLLETPVAAEAEGEGGARWPPRGAVPLVEADVPLAVVRAIRSRAKPGRPSELTLLTTRVREAREVLLEFGEIQRRHNHLRDSSQEACRKVVLPRETWLSLLQPAVDWGSWGTKFCYWSALGISPLCKAVHGTIGAPVHRIRPQECTVLRYYAPQGREVIRRGHAAWSMESIRPRNGACPVQHTLS